VLVGIAVGAAVGSAHTLFGTWAPANSTLARLLEWTGSHHYVSVTIAGTVVSTLWFFGAALFFGHRIPPARAAEIDRFFVTMRTPIEPTAEAVEENNSRGTLGIGRMCLVYSGFILLLILLPNPVTGRLAILFCAAFVGLVGYGLIRAGRPTTPR
jgi:hypothetical protein